MKRASISEAKNQLSALIDYVRHGASVLILDRGRPVARLDGISDEGGDERLARLERAGLIVRGTGPFPAKLIAQKPPSATASVLEALLDERREGR
jgi:prevent-host-death family protein